MATKSKCDGARYRFQRVFSELKVGKTLGAQAKRQAPVQFFMRQDSVSGSCGILCIGMAYAAMGVIKASAFAQAPRRKTGCAPDLWKILADTFFTGINVSDLNERLLKLDLPVSFTCRTGASESVDKFAIAALSRGQITLLAYENERNHYKHYVLGVGVSGIAEGRQSKIDSLLALCPGGDDPVLNTHNCILRAVPAKTPKKRRANTTEDKLPQRWMCETSDNHDAEYVFLIGAISFRPHAKR